MMHQGGDVTETLIWIQLVIGPKWENKVYRLWISHYVIFFNSLLLYVSVRGRGETVSFVTTDTNGSISPALSIRWKAETSEEW
jgi:hypothetical protein